MTGGTWTKQNKVRPGAYINFKAQKNPTILLGERGIATLPLNLSWGPEKKVVEVGVDDDLFDSIGINIGDPAAQQIREVFKRAKTLLFYRLNSGNKATATLGNLTVTAKYSGTKGNNIIIFIQNSIDDATAFYVITMFEGKQVDIQVVKTIADLKSNAFVEFKGVGELQVTAGLPLKGGDDGTITNQDYTDYLAAIELYEFNCMGISTKDTSIKAIATNFIKRLREQEGKKVQLVLDNYPEADYEGVISVKNGVILSDNTEITSDRAVAWVAGATAGANINESLTYTNYDGAVDVDTRYTNKEIENALKNGEIVFTLNKGKVIIEQDINTLKTIAEDKSKDFRKNRVIRVLDGIGNNVKALYEDRYIGKISNNEDGRNLFRKDVIKQLEVLQGMGALENVIPEDVEILPGIDKDSVIARLGVQPVDAMEKLYMDVEVR